MKKEVFDYFQDLHKSDLTVKDGVFVQDKHLKKEGGTISSNVRVFHYQGIPYYAKDIYGKYSIQAMCASQMYNDLGVLTPPIYPLLRKPYTKLAIMSQDVCSVKGLFAEQLFMLEEYRKIKSGLSFNEMFYNKMDIHIRHSNQEKMPNIYDRRMLQSDTRLNGA